MRSTAAAPSAVNGGQMTTSTPSSSPARGRNSARNASASATVLCIFQFAATSGRATRALRHRAGPPPPAAACPRSAPARRRRRSRASRPRSARPNRASAAAESPPPTTVNAGAVGDRLGDARVPAANGSSSKAPIGPFQNTVPAAAIASAYAAAVAGRCRAPSSRRGPRRRRPPRRSASASKRVGRSRGRRGSVSSQSRARARSSTCAASSTPSSSTSESPVVDPAARERTEAHRAADQDRVGGLEEALDHADLVGHLGAAEDDDERPPRVVADRGQLAHLALEQQPGVAGQEVGDPLGARVGAVGGAEGVVDVEVGERGERRPRARGRSSSRRARSGCSRAAAARPGRAPRPPLDLGADDRRRERRPRRRAARRAARRPAPSRARARGPWAGRGGRRGPPRPRARAAARSSAARRGSGCRRRPRAVLAVASGTLKSTRTSTALALDGGVANARLGEASPRSLNRSTSRGRLGSSTFAASSTQRFE